MKKQLISIIALMGIAPAIWAHGGEHHGFMPTLWHVLTQPDHLFGIIAGSVIGLGLIATLLLIKRSANKRLASEHK